MAAGGRRCRIIDWTPHNLLLNNPKRHTQARQIRPRLNRRQECRPGDADQRNWFELSYQRLGRF
jgi:hypothetical protein